MSIPPPGSRATKVLDAFRTEHGISAHVRAPAERVWALLTNAADLPRWNTTVTSIEGQVALGAKIKLRVASSERTSNRQALPRGLTTRDPRGKRSERCKRPSSW